MRSRAGSSLFVSPSSSSSTTTDSRRVQSRSSDKIVFLKGESTAAVDEGTLHNVDNGQDLTILITRQWLDPGWNKGLRRNSPWT